MVTLQLAKDTKSTREHLICQSHLQDTLLPSGYICTLVVTLALDAAIVLETTTQTVMIVFHDVPPH